MITSSPFRIYLSFSIYYNFRKGDERMNCGITIRLFVVFTLLGVVFSGNLQAQEIKFPATIYLIQGSRPIFIEDFSPDGKQFYDAVQNEKNIKLEFKDIKTIEFIDPGKRTFEANVTFNDGRKDKYRLVKPGNIEINSSFSVVTMSHVKVAKIEFGPSQKKNEQARTEQVKAEQEKFDRIILKNGDNLSGKLQAKTFALKTSYGAFNFEAPQIAYIDFDAKGKDVDVVVLKIGDRLSGTVHAEPIKFLLRSGKEVNLEIEAIKKIIISR